VYSLLPEGRPWRSWAALAGALALHAAVASLTYMKGRSGGDEAAGPMPAAMEAEIDVDLGAPGAQEPSAVEPRPEDDRPGARAELDSKAKRHAAPSTTEGAIIPESGPPEVGPEGKGGYALDPTAPRSPTGTSEGPPIDLGIGSGDWSRYVDPTARVEAPRPPRPGSTAPPASSTGGLAEALEAHDREVGLGPDGPVLTAAHEAGHSDVAPAIGTATFSITVTSAGGVQVDLTGVSSNVGAWRKVADKLAAAIKRKPPRIVGGRNGVRFALELVAEERWPNGQVARSEGPALALALPTLRSTDQSIEDLSKRNPFAVPPPGSPAEQPQLKLNVDLPGLYLKGRGKVCSYQVGISPFGPGLSGGCDPSNIGARAQRVVSAKITDQSML
jgi:hypothetical protein